MNLKGKTAIVTGAGRDIGRACALKLAAAGAAVAVNYFSSSDGADATVAEIKAAGGRAFAMQGDMTKADEARALADRTAAEFGGIDVLVNNTGGLVARVKVTEMSLEHWNTVMDLNVTSTFLLTNAVLQHMTDGAIVNIVSQAARDGGGPGASVYAASKGALLTWTRGLAKELAPDIRVNGVCPGMIDTDFHNVFTKPEVRTAVAGNTPLKREGQSDEVANLVAFLASSDGSYITGANVDINGGLLFS
ncbi:SDR family NAD(P)-dependent oxidoreductase [Actibacterium sp. 188UL27-1]|uniref:SDR family NAD(P)-dependent oxidoreductase n=1 Tax=Actibacterium sp. 188UL27-1 TaxID=2786961 RepID=UPI00195D13FE|nr:glucose 1-dehydrogenase [Actibacterium sp. 188UL27-1]MBM7069178.1 glucose 1-dehydrogenase [Actibacterium sp. 188UL27-1]